MDASAHPMPLVGADRPFFATRESLDDMRSMSSVTVARGDLSIGRYRRDRPGLGISSPNPISPMVMAVVIHRSRPAHAGWHDGRLVEVPPLGAGALTCLDLREAWTMDISAPFDSFHAFIPWTAFDEVTAELRRPRIEALNRQPGVEQRDETMLGLARSMNPVMARPEHATALFADHVFLAMVTHLAVAYGGLETSGVAASAAAKARLLSPIEERRVTSRLLDDLDGDTSLSELAALCGRSRSQFIRAFKQSTGMPPHRWLLMQRVKRAKDLLRGTNTPIAEIALACGFSDQSHLTRVFSKAFRISPGAWRRQWKP
ncbi:MAG TPA: AraC family transcriptional regulator [Gemmatimonadaceae bacterium]|jgi:AraC-like DNA-binding protein|nr:AraC family transcriptional regulator [Gemmatimonadaceae bacterium]